MAKNIKVSAKSAVIHDTKGQHKEKYNGNGGITSSLAIVNSKNS